MKTKFLKHLISPTGFTIGLILLNLVLIGFGRANKLDGTTWPGWIQGIGSVEAILVAVWVSWHQSASQRRLEERREEAEVLGMLRCIRTEVVSLRAHIDMGVGKALRDSRDHTAFQSTFPLDADPFPIYKAFIPNLGLIDDLLRSQIVKTYGRAQSFVSTFRHHNLLLEQANEASYKALAESNFFTREAAEKRWTQLSSYSDALRSSFAEVNKLADELLILLPPE